MFRAFFVAIRRFFSRRAAKRLVAQQLPRGLLPAPFRLALRVPPPLEPPEGEFWLLPLGAHAIRGRAPRRLLRLAALPPPPVRLDVLRPASLRLDSELRLPTEIDPLRLPSDAPPPAKARRVRPRTPLARAPLARVRPRNFRLDSEGHSANEGILPLQPRDSTWHWVVPAFRRRFVDLPWMARERIRFLGPMQAEWFRMWRDKVGRRRPGARDPHPYVLARELEWALEACKEQMLIRRDVKKDESGPEPQEFYFVEVGHPIVALEHEPLTALVPEKEWIAPGGAIEPLPFDRNAREAYLQWRTLVDALQER